MDRRLLIHSTAGLAVAPAVVHIAAPAPVAAPVSPAVVPAVANR